MRRKLDFVQRHLVLEAYESGMKQREIAGRVKVSQPTISQAVKQARYERRIAELSGRNIIVIGMLERWG